MSRNRILVDLFLNDEISPMPLSVVYDADGPREVEIALGRFQNRRDAMSAIEKSRQFLQDGATEWTHPAAALAAVQPVALRSPGNLGLVGADIEVGAPGASFERPHAEDGSGREGLAARVLTSPIYVAQRSRATRVTLADEQIGALLMQLLGAPSHRIDRSTAASVLGVSASQVLGAVSMVQRILNVDQYPVLDRDAAGVIIVLDVDLLEEQFGVRG